MIRGYITEDEATVSVRLRGRDGSEVELQAVLDTGFNRFLTLSPSWIASLDLSFLSTVPVRLGNKHVDVADIYEGRIHWNGQWKKIEIQDQVSEETPLLGMAMLRGSLVTLQVIDDGEVTIEPVE